MPNEAIAKTRRRTNAIYVSISAVIVVMYILGAVALARAVASENRARRIAEETQTTLAQTGSLLITVLDAETGQRGYLMTGDEDYLSPFFGKRNEFNNELSNLRKQLEKQRDAGSQIKALDRIAALSSERFDLLDQGIVARRDNNLSAALQIIRNGAGKTAMEAIRGEIRAIRDFEEGRLYSAFASARLLQSRTAAALGFLLLVTLIALISAAILVRRAIQAETAAQFAQQLRVERDRADLISRELSHRVKNLFAVIMSIISTTGRAETDAREASRKIRERVQALSRAHALSNGQNPVHTARLGDLVTAIVQPYAPPGRTVAMAGPEIWLSADRVTPVGLILNELATNTVKYGAWSTSEGTLSITWAFDGNDEQSAAQKGPVGHTIPFRLIWTEKVPTGQISEPVTQGFGTNMIDLSATQARAEVSRNWEADGLTVVLKLEADGPGGG